MTKEYNPLLPEHPLELHDFIAVIAEHHLVSKETVIERMVEEGILTSDRITPTPESLEYGYSTIMRGFRYTNKALKLLLNRPQQEGNQG